MALLTTISETNRIDEQGAVWNFDVKPVSEKDEGGQGVQYWVYQWKAVVSFTRSYRYVGLTKAAAEEIADDIRTAYTMKRTRQTVRWSPSSNRWIFNTVEKEPDRLEAEVVPSMMEGRMWQIAVTVNAEREYFYSQRNPPSVEVVKGLLDGIEDYPELNPPEEEEEEP